MATIDEGMQIEVTATQSENADDPNREGTQSLSNATVERHEQPVKQAREIVSTDEGMQIDPSEPQPENADSPRVATREPVSNVSVQSLWH
jgi:hypothetical protein